jgi:hypothetical protein
MPEWVRGRMNAFQIVLGQEASRLGRFYWERAQRMPALI